MNATEARQRLAEYPWKDWDARQVEELIVLCEQTQELLDLALAQLARYERPPQYSTGTTTTPEWLKNARVYQTTERVPDLSAGAIWISDDFNAPMELVNSAEWERLKGTPDEGRLLDNSSPPAEAPRRAG